MTLSRLTDKQGSRPVPGTNERKNNVKPKSGLFGTMYKWWKYGTFIGVVLSIVLVGVVVLGDVSEDVEEDKALTALYKGSSVYSEAAEEVNKLLNSKKSSFISNKVVNLYLEQSFDKNDNQSDLDTKFADLSHFSDFFLTQRYPDQHYSKFSLALYERNFYKIVEQPTTSKALRQLKARVQAVFQKKGWAQNDDVKEFKWSRAKKLLEGGKIGQLMDLTKNSAINWVWEWIGKPSKVIVLTTDESAITKTNPGTVERNKKLLKKWIEQNEDSTEIIILSKYSINGLYDSSKEDVFKSYKIEASLDKFEKTSLCRYLKEQEELNEAQCNLIRGNFNSFHQLSQFVANNNENSDLFEPIESQELQELVKKVCEKGHVKYYFYENQQNANKVLQRNKKAKKSRLDREMEALLVKFSQLKHWIGINRVKDVYNTLTASEQGEKLSLREVNSVGLLYDFEHHELRWRNEEERIGYEMRVERSCNGEKFVQEEKKEEEEKQSKERQKDESQEEQQSEQVTEQQLEQEYEENTNHYRDGEQTAEEEEEADEVVQDEGDGEQEGQKQQDAATEQEQTEQVAGEEREASRQEEDQIQADQQASQTQNENNSGSENKQQATGAYEQTATYEKEDPENAEDEQQKTQQEQQSAEEQQQSDQQDEENDQKAQTQKNIESDQENTSNTDQTGEEPTDQQDESVAEDQESAQSQNHASQQDQQATDQTEKTQQNPNPNQSSDNHQPAVQSETNEPNDDEPSQKQDQSIETNPQSQTNQQLQATKKQQASEQQQAKVSLEQQPADDSLEQKSQKTEKTADSGQKTKTDEGTQTDTQADAQQPQSGHSASQQAPNQQQAQTEASNQQSAQPVQQN